MTPERHRQIVRLYHLLLELDVAERSVFIAQTCSDDEALRNELESLLASHLEAENFLETPAIEIAAKMLADDRERDMVGRCLGHYEIKALLGAGGMGEVYLAQDSKLDREVALKLLPVEVAADLDRMRRFTREAKAASALNHPNIITIHEIGQSDSGEFIVTEFIDGRTLRQQMQTAPIQLDEVLDVSTQVARALLAAHAAGIVHRDIKPENLMLRRDGIVKVLDFGIAKLVEEPPANSSGFTERSFINTEPAKVMGTVSYMSPEQARGTPVDGRSDIFSLGVVIYEMVTGSLPFAGSTSTEVLAVIGSDKELPPLDHYTNAVPAKLEQIIFKALRKNRNERYQTIETLLADLTDLASQLDSEARVERRSVTGLPRRSTTESLEYLLRRRGVAAISLATLIIAAAALTYFSYFKPNRAPVLTDRDTVLIADFDNKTGDTDFDGTLKQALVMQVEQSPFFTVFSDTRIRETLAYMKRSPGERLLHETAREICQREGIKAMLTGSIAPLGAHYYLTLEAIDPGTGEVLAQTQTEVESKERVLRALSQAATELRQKLGESLTSIHRFDAPLERATTSSLEALKDFSLAMGQTGPDALATKIALYKRAIELDPDFALAHARLSLLYIRSQQVALAMEAARKAFELKDRVSEWEQFDISIRYYQLVTVEWDKVVETAQLWISTYPKSPQPYNILATHFRWSGQYERAIEAANEAMKRPPSFVSEYENLGQALMGLNRFREAKDVFEQALAQKLESDNIHKGLYVLAFINDDAPAMQRQLDALGTQSNDLASSWEAETAAFAGQSERARELFRLAVDSRKAKGVTAPYASEEFLWGAVFGRCRQSEAKAWQRFSLAHIRASFDTIGLGLALCGEAELLKGLIIEAKQQEPKHTFISGLYLSIIEAASEIETNKPALALRTLATLGQYENAAGFWPRYLRGQAYLRLKRGTEAAVEFQSIVDHRGQDPLSPLYPLAHLGLARATALAGNSVASRKAYDDFFTLWKDADASLPLALDAKKDYKKITRLPAL